MTLKPRRRSPLDRAKRLLGLDKPENTQPEYAYRAPSLGLDRSVPDTQIVANIAREMADVRAGLPLLLRPDEISPDHRPPTDAQIAALDVSDARAIAKTAPLLSSQAERDRLALQRALDRVPGAMLGMVEAALAALTEAEEQLLEKRTRLATLATGLDDSAWIDARAHLTLAIGGLEALVVERLGEYRRAIRMVVDHRLDNVLWEQETAAADAHDAARERYQQLLAEMRSELGRLANARTAIGRVRGQLQHAGTAEALIGGRQVTTEPKPADDRQARRAAGLQLSRGAKQ